MKTPLPGPVALTALAGAVVGAQTTAYLKPVAPYTAPQL
jgi:hypothetical protein